MKKCATCGTSLRGSKMCYEIGNFCPEMISLLESQLKRENIEDEHLCEECFNQATSQVLPLEQVKEESEEDPFEEISHLTEEDVKVELPVEKEESEAEAEEMITEVNRCAWCLQILHKQMLKHKLTDGPEKDYIVADIFPRKITPANRVCDVCWLQLSSILNPKTRKRNIAKIETETCFTPDVDDVSLDASPTKILKATETDDESSSSSADEEDKTTNSGRKSRDSKDDDSMEDDTKENIVDVSDNDSNQEDEVLIPSEDAEKDEKKANSEKEESSDDNSSDEEDKEWRPPAALENSLKRKRLVVPEEHKVQKQTDEEMASVIILPHYRITSNTRNRCFVRDCKGTERRQVPAYLRKVLMESYNVFVPFHARVCNEHVKEYYRDWTFLKNLKYRNVFSATAIENVLDLLRKDN